MNDDSMSKREPQAMTLDPGGSRNDEVILAVVVSVSGPRKFHKKDVRTMGSAKTAF